MNNPQSHISVTQINGQAALSVSGRLDFKNVVKLRREGKRLLAAQTGAATIVDLQAVTASDNSGLVLLVAWKRDAQHGQKQLVYQHVPDFLQRMAQVFGLHSILFK